MARRRIERKVSPMTTGLHPIRPVTPTRTGLHPVRPTGRPRRRMVGTEIARERRRRAKR